MNTKERLSENRKIKLLYKTILIVSGLVILVTTMYGLIESIRGYFTTGVVTVGEILVGIEWPLPYFAKPVTYLSFAIVAFWFSLVKLYQHSINNFSNLRVTLLSFIALLVAFGAAYEVLYNFTVWGALMSAEAFRGYVNPDFLNIPYPNPKVPWNLVFATKFFIALFVISSYSWIILQRRHSLYKEEVRTLKRRTVQ